MAKMILMCGPPGSGKSTLAKKLESEGFVRVSQDDQGKSGHQELFRESIRAGKDVVVDRMNFNKQQRNDYLVTAKAANYETEIRVVHEPYEVCLDRALNRQGHPTITDEKGARSAIQTFFTKYERPLAGEADVLTFIYPEKEKLPAVICDLDGTFADCEHRRHHVRRTDGQKKDWRSFFLDMSKDPIIFPVYEILFKFQGTSLEDCNIVFCSGRPDDYRKLTKEWLAQTGIQYTALYMRNRHDSRQDDIIKEILLDFEILTRFKPKFILDDRDQVVKMWRRRGFMCLQVAEGDF